MDVVVVVGRGRASGRLSRATSLLLTTMAKGKSINPADAFSKSKSCTSSRTKLYDLQERLSARKSSRRCVGSIESSGRDADTRATTTTLQQNKTERQKTRDFALVKKDTSGA